MPEIIFQRPKFKKLHRGYSYVDMHFHSRYSMDGRASIPRIVKKAKKLGIGVAICDHGEIAGAIEAVRKHPDVLIIPAIELHTMEGVHLLFYFPNIKSLQSFYRKTILPRKMPDSFGRIKISAASVIDEAKQYDCLIAAPHPFAGFFGGLDYLNPSIKMWQKINAVEVINGSIPRKYNLKARNFALHHSMGLTGGSDGHLLSDLGRVLTVAEGETPKEFLKSIRKRKSSVIGKEESLPKKLLETAIKEAQYWRKGLKKKQKSLIFQRIKYHIRNLLPYVLKNHKFKLPPLKD